MPDFVRSHGPKVAIGGLVAINVALIAALLTREPALTAGPAGAPAPPSASETSAQSAGPTSMSPTASASRSGASPSATAAPGEGSPAAARLLAVNSAQVVWRADAGSCEHQSRLEVSTDGGDHWRQVDSGLRAIVRLKAYADESVFAVGVDDNCRSRFVRLADPEATAVVDSGQLESTWYRAPSGNGDVHAPGGNTSQPCKGSLVDLAGLGTYQAAALCSDGRVRTIDQGRSWRTVRTEPGVLALNADDEQFIALTRGNDCDGLRVQRFATSGKGLGGRAGRCAKGTTEPPVAVAIRGATTALWRGDGTEVS